MLSVCLYVYLSDFEFLLDRYIEDLHSVSDKLKAVASSRVVTSSKFPLDSPVISLHDSYTLTSIHRYQIDII